jgi:MoaA/NifB/PqqE/SkfB family radical SAM enzyme
MSVKVQETIECGTQSPPEHLPKSAQNADAGPGSLPAAWFACRIREVWATIVKAWRSARYVTFLKLLNMVLVNVQRLFKTETVLGRPYRVAIEPTNICNANCQLCPLREGDAGRQKGVMEWALYKKLVDEWSRWVYSLHLYLWGDPLCADSIYPMIQYAHRAGMRTLLATNMHAFYPDGGDDAALVKSGLDDLTCSIHAASQETFEIYQPGRNFDDVVEKVRRLVETKERLKSRTPTIHLNFVVTKFNEHEIPAFEQLARGLGCEPFFIEPSLNLRFFGRDKSDEERNRMIQNRVDTWLPENPKYVIEPYRRMRQEHVPLDQLNGGKGHGCKMLWTGTVFNWDGGVAPCFGCRDKREDFGNVTVETFRDVWNGAKYRAARQSFRREIETDVACARCSGIML